MINSITDYNDMKVKMGAKQSTIPLEKSENDCIIDIDRTPQPCSQSIKVTLVRASSNYSSWREFCFAIMNNKHHELVHTGSHIISHENKIINLTLWDNTMHSVKVDSYIVSIFKEMYDILSEPQINEKFRRLDTLYGKISVMPRSKEQTEAIKDTFEIYREIRMLLPSTYVENIDLLFQHIRSS